MREMSCCIFLENLFASQQVLCTIKQLQMRDEATKKYNKKLGSYSRQKDKLDICSKCVKKGGGVNKGLLLHNIQLFNRIPLKS